MGGYMLRFVLGLPCGGWSALLVLALLRIRVQYTPNIMVLASCSSALGTATSGWWRAAP